MTKYLTALPLLAALMMAAPAVTFAQTTTADDATAEATESTAETTTETTDEAASSDGTTSITDQLSLGEEATDSSPVGQPFTKEVIGAWELRCIATAGEEDTCQMYQLMEDAEGNPVAEVSMFRLAGGGKAKAGATVIVPLETSLPQQLTVTVDGGKARRYPFVFCNPVGCYVRLGLTDADVNAFKRGNEALFTIVPALAPDQKVALKLSLDGFTATYDKVSVVSQ